MNEGSATLDGVAPRNIDIGHEHDEMSKEDWVEENVDLLDGTTMVQGAVDSTELEFFGHPAGLFVLFFAWASPNRRLIDHRRQTVTVPK